MGTELGHVPSAERRDAVVQDGPLRVAGSNDSRILDSKSALGHLRGKQASGIQCQMLLDVEGSGSASTALVTMSTVQM